MIGQNLEKLRNLIVLHLRVSNEYRDRREEDDKALEALPYDAVVEMQTIQTELLQLKEKHKHRRFWQFQKKARNLSTMEELNKHLHVLQERAKKEQADVNNLLVEIVERELEIIEDKLLKKTEEIIRTIKPGTAEQGVAKHIMARAVELFHNIAKLLDNITEDDEEMIQKKVHSMEDEWVDYITYLERFPTYFKSLPKKAVKNKTRRKRPAWRP